jgi:hypothetical protein
MPNLIDVITIVSSDWTKEASQRGRSAIVVKTAPRRIFVVELDSWHLCVKGCAGLEKIQMMVFAWSMRSCAN